MLCEALGMHSVLAHIALQDVLMFFDMVCAPCAEVMIDERTRPFIAMELIMPRVEVAIAVNAMFSDALGHVAVAI